MEGHQGSASPPRWSFDREPQHHNLAGTNAAMPFASFFPLFRDTDENAAPSHGSRLRPSSLYRPASGEHSNPPPAGSSSVGTDNARSQGNPYPPIGRRSVGDGLDDRRRLTSIDVLARPTPRFAGDGFDFRRPIRAVREQDTASVDLTGDDDDEDDMDLDLDPSGELDVIDLTADDSGYGDSQDDNSSAARRGEGQERPSINRAANSRGTRLPRGMDIIIDLDNGAEEWTMDAPQQADPSADPAAEPSSPDIEFISSRRIFPPRHPPPLNRSRSDGDEVEFIGANRLTHDEIRRRRNEELDNVLDLLGTMNGRFTHLRAQVDRFNAQVNRTADRFRRGPVPPPRMGRVHGHVRSGTFMAPRLDFDMVAFDLGIPGGRAAEPPPPTYDAPRKAPEGFTRSPEEKDVLVCPNCEHELCCGPDDVKKQVWIVKSCGHVRWLIYAISLSY